MKRIGVLTSGGDSPGMNAAIRAVVRAGIDRGMEVYGIERGFQGLIEGEIRNLGRRSVGDIMQRGGTILKTARSTAFQEKGGLEQAAARLRAFEIEGLVVIGGDGSLRGGLALSSKGIKVMGIPGTIDNDLGYTDFTIGFDTAVTTVLDAISKVRDTSSAHERTTVIEVMGRSCGDIALYSALAGGAEAALIPEMPYDINHLCRKILTATGAGKKHSIIIKAEGVDISSQELVRQIEEKTGRNTRLVVLSYLQRGGSPTMSDRILATLCGAKAVDLLWRDSESKAIGTVCGGITASDLDLALQQERSIDEEKYRLIDILSK